MVHLKPLIDKKQIASKIKEVASWIDEEYRNSDLVLLVILKGAICFAADLIRAIHISCDFQTVQCSSYGSRGIERGPLSVFGLDRLDIQQRDVLILDDIYDSGITLRHVFEKIKEKQPRSIKSLVLLTRKNSLSQPDRSLFSIDGEFVVGYGLDFKEKYRGLNGIYSLEEH